MEPPLKGSPSQAVPQGGESRSPSPPGEEFEKDKAERPRPSYLKKHVQKRRESNPPQRGFSSDAVNTGWGEGRSPPPMENLKQSNERNFYPASSWTIWRQTNGETGAPLKKSPSLALPQRGEREPDPPPGKNLKRIHLKSRRPPAQKRMSKKRRVCNPPPRRLSSDAVRKRWGERRRPPHFENVKQSNDRNFYPASSCTT